MNALQTEIADVVYNAASQQFEARVTVHDLSGSRSYACAVDGPITLPFARAAERLSQQALRYHRKGGTVPLLSRRTLPKQPRPSRDTRNLLRRGLPLGQYGFFRGRAA